MVVNIGSLDQSNAILGGDLNLTLTTNEIWGKNARSDAMDSFFSSFFKQKGPIDIDPLSWNLHAGISEGEIKIHKKY